MINQLYADLVALRSAELLEEAARERRVNEAMQAARVRASSEPRRPMKLSWISRWIPSGLRPKIAARG
jgi:hypothetical protein